MTPRNYPGKRLLLQAVICWLVILGVCSGALASESKPAKKILILFSYQTLTPGFFEWDAGIRSVLKGSALEPLELYTEFLDLARFPDQVHMQDLVNFLEKKYRGKKVDLLIPVGPLAFHFLLDQGSNIFPGVLLAECLKVVGYDALADNIEAVSRNIQKLRWQARLTTGFNPVGVSIPKRFTEVTTWKGQVDGEFLTGLKTAYAKRILELGTETPG